PPFGTAFPSKSKNNSPSPPKTRSSTTLTPTAPPGSTGTPAGPRSLPTSTRNDTATVPTDEPGPPHATKATDVQIDARNHATNRPVDCKPNPCEPHCSRGDRHL